MHILIGALVGAVLGAVGAVIMAKIMRQPVTWKTVAAGAIGGAVGGAVTAATLGAGGAAAATAARAATAYVAGGGTSGGTTRLAENLLDGKPAQNGVIESTAVGAGSGLAFYGLGRLVAPVVERFAPKLPFLGRAPPAEPEPPKAPPWENYPWRVKPPAEPGQTVRVKIADLRTRQVTIDHRGYYSETELYDPSAGQVTSDPTKGVPMIPDVSWVDWIDGQEPFWALREGNHRTFDALLEGREDVLAKVVFMSRETAEASLWGERPYAPFLKSGVWDVNDNYMGTADQFKGIGRGNMSFMNNPLTRQAAPSKTPGFVTALGGD
jgi:hypothetical protein